MGYQSMAQTSKRQMVPCSETLRVGWKAHRSAKPTDWPTDLSMEKGLERPSLVMLSAGTWLHPAAARRLVRRTANMLIPVRAALALVRQSARELSLGRAAQVLETV